MLHAAAYRHFVMKADTGQLQEFLKLNDISAMVMSIASRSFSMENRVPFVFILDEMTTFKVRDFEKLPSVLREYGAAFLLLTQSEGKLEKLYSKLDRSSIEANFGNIFLGCTQAVSYTHLRAHETGRNLVCRLLLEKKKIHQKKKETRKKKKKKKKTE